MKEIPGFPNYFACVDTGSVFSKKWGRLYRLTPSPCRQGGYLKVGIIRDGKRQYLTVHRIIALVAFGERPEGKEINHKNGNKFDNRQCNLEYVSRLENMRHRMSVLYPDRYPPLTSEMIEQIFARHARGGVTLKRLAEEYGVSKHRVYRAMKSYAADRASA